MESGKADDEEVEEEQTQESGITKYYSPELAPACQGLLQPSATCVQILATHQCNTSFWEHDTFSNYYCGEHVPEVVTAPAVLKKVMEDSALQKPSPQKKRGRKPKVQAAQAEESKPHGKAKAKAKAKAKSKNKRNACKGKKHAKTAQTRKESKNTPKRKAQPQPKKQAKQRAGMSKEENAAADLRSQKCCAYRRVRKEMLQKGFDDEAAKAAARKVSWLNFLEL